VRRKTSSIARSISILTSFRMVVSNVNQTGLASETLNIIAQAYTF
jgi:hypothetical protein